MAKQLCYSYFNGQFIHQINDCWVTSELFNALFGEIRYCSQANLVGLLSELSRQLMWYHNPSKYLRCRTCHTSQLEYKIEIALCCQNQIPSELIKILIEMYDIYSPHYDLVGYLPDNINELDLLRLIRLATELIEKGISWIHYI